MSSSLRISRSTEASLAAALKVTSTASEINSLIVNFAKSVTLDLSISEYG